MKKKIKNKSFDRNILICCNLHVEHLIIQLSTLIKYEGVYNTPNNPSKRATTPKGLT